MSERGSFFPTFGRILRWRVWRKVGLALLVVVLVGGLANGIGTLYYGGKVRAKLAALKAAGKPLTGRDVAPPPIPEADNAAPLYLEAARIVARHFAGMRDVRTEVRPNPVGEGYVSYGLARSHYHPAVVAIVARYLREDARALELLRQAQARRGVDFGADRDHLPFPYRPYDLDLRLLELVVADAAVVASQAGDQERAFELLRLGFALARPLSAEPQLAGLQAAAYSDWAIIMPAAQRVLSRGAIPEPAARRLVQELARIDYLGGYLRAVQGERVLGLKAYAMVQRGTPVAALVYDAEAPWPTRLYHWAYPHILRPVLYADELLYLRAMDQREARAALTPRQRSAAPLPDPGQAADVPHWAVVNGVVPMRGETIAIRAANAAAHRRLLQAALGIELYRQRHGRYPESLAQVRKMGWPTLPDVYTEKDPLYRRVGERYLLYSVGSDLKDEGGRPSWWQRDLQGRIFGAPGVPRDDTGDIVWIHEREPAAPAVQW